MTDTTSADTTKPRPAWRRALAFSLPVIVVAGAVLAAVVLVKTRPHAERRTPPPMTALVRTEAVAPSTEHIVVEARGTVVPAREIMLRSRVPGEIVSVSGAFIEGGLVEANREILKIDPVDSELAVARAASRLASAQYEMSLEKGRLQVARREWELLDADAVASDEERSLALREPQQARLAAELKAAEAELRQAELNLERTSVTAPFNAIVTKRFAELGARVSTQDTLANLVGTDEFWVQTSVPVDRLRWLDVPRGPDDTGSPARIYAPGSNRPWEGTVLRLLGDVEARGRMARLLVRVEDPMCLEDPDSSRLPLLLGSYVRVELQGQELEEVIRIPRTALRDNTKVWVARPDDTLDIRTADVVWRGPADVFLGGGVTAGERVVVSDLAMPIQGMQLRVENGHPLPRTGQESTQPAAAAGDEG